MMAHEAHKAQVLNMLTFNRKCVLTKLDFQHTDHKTKKSVVYIPYVAVFAVSHSSINDSVFVVARAFLMRHTLLFFVHVGSLGTAAAVHWSEADLARVVSLTK